MELKVKTFTGCDTSSPDDTKELILCPYCGSADLTLNLHSNRVICNTCLKSYDKNERLF